MAQRRWRRVRVALKAMPAAIFVALALLKRFARHWWHSGAQPRARVLPPVDPREYADRNTDPEQVVFVDGRIEHPRIRFEGRDVGFRGVVLVVVASVAFAAVHLFAITEYFGWRQRHQQREKSSHLPLLVGRPEALPPEPRLEQIDRLEGMLRPNVYLRQSVREAQLERYGATGDKDFIHIPIQRAIEQLLDQLRNQKPPSTASKDRGLVDSGDSNSGRMFRGPGP